MASEMSIIDKNEYLKKYLSGGKEGKKSKKKKKVKTTQQRSMIIDDDIDISQLNTMKEVEDLFETNEDAPQIVKVTDHTLRLTIEDYRNSNLWKPIGEIDDTNQNEETDSGQHTALTPKVSESDDGGKNKYDDDCSPPRRMKKGSPARKKRSSSPLQSRNNSNSNPLRKMNSPPRRSRGSSPSHSRLNRDSSPPRKTTTNTPPRKAKNKSYYDNGPFPPPSTDNNLSNKSKNKWNNDASPQRKSRKGSEDNSPRRKSKSQHSFDKSSPRRIKRRSPSPDANYGSSRKSNSKMNDDNSPPRKSKVNHEIDSSPLRRVNSPVIRSRWESDDNSPPRRRQDIDSSPPRRIKRENNSPNADNSPPRKFKSRWQSTDNNDIKSQSTSSEGRNSSPPRKKQKEEEIPKPRKLLPGDKKGKYLIPAKRQLEKLTTTLDGKTAGLQNASELTKELQAHRAREDLLYQTISPEALGATAAPIMRDRSTGKVRDLEKEAEELRKKQQKESESREKYTRWGKGLKQVEDYNEQLTQDLHEMQKPLARYADDEDLERHLKEQLREGDPMLAYIKKKRRKENIATGKEIDKPQYEGECLPNRYGIRPGHRWDGVDRSNGYEQKWFEKQNSRKAEQEEIYKWSTEDM